MTDTSKDKGLWNSYDKTIVKIYFDGKVLTESQMKENWKSDFYMITAFNPFSEPLDEEANKARNIDLHNLLSEHYGEILAGVGKDPSGQWAGEDSWIVQGGDEEMLIFLAKKFEQNAIFKFTQTGRVIIDCR